jgi:hypothetical protein
MPNLAAAAKTAGPTAAQSARLDANEHRGVPTSPRARTE